MVFIRWCRYIYIELVPTFYWVHVLYLGIHGTKYRLVLGTYMYMCTLYYVPINTVTLNWLMFIEILIPQKYVNYLYDSSEGQRYLKHFLKWLNFLVFNCLTFLIVWLKQGYIKHLFKMVEIFNFKMSNSSYWCSKYSQLFIEEVELYETELYNMTLKEQSQRNATYYSFKDSSHITLFKKWNLHGYRHKLISPKGRLMCYL